MLRRTVETLQLLAGPVTRWSGRAALTAARSFLLAARKSYSGIASARPVVSDAGDDPADQSRAASDLDRLAQMVGTQESNLPGSRPVAAVPICGAGFKPPAGLVAYQMPVMCVISKVRDAAITARVTAEIGCPRIALISVTVPNQIAKNNAIMNKMVFIMFPPLRLPE